MSVSLERVAKTRKSHFQKKYQKASTLALKFGVFWKSLASLGPLWDQLLRMCLHSCVPTLFFTKFGAPGHPRMEVGGRGGDLVALW